MAPTPTKRLRLAKQDPFSNPNTWGEWLNEVLDRLDDGFGTLQVVVNANVVLTAVDFLPDQSRNFVLILTGTGGFTVTVPQTDKPYLVVNRCADAVTVKPGSGMGAAVRASSAVMWYCDGTDAFVVDPTLNGIRPPNANVDFNGKKAVNLGAAQSTNDAATLANRLDQFAKPAVDLDLNAKKIANLADGVAPTDAATVGQIAAVVAPYAQAAANSAVAAGSSASSAAGSAGAASGSAGAAAGSAGAALASENKASEWADKPENSPVETDPDRFSALHWSRKAEDWALTLNLPTIQPGDAGKALIVKPDETGFALGRPMDFTRTARTSNTQITANDIGAFIDITSGSFSQTFAAVSTLANGWFVYLRNSGTGDITLDPNGSETIDGLTDYIMYPGEMRLIYSDGSALRSIVVGAFLKTFTASGTFVKPPGYIRFEGLLWSGGASGESVSSTSTAASGGKGGGCFPFVFAPNELSAANGVTIGAGGAASYGSINIGGDSSFKDITVYGALTTRGGSVFNHDATVPAWPTGFEGRPTAANRIAASGIYGGAGTTSTLGGIGIFGGGGGGSITAANAAGAAGYSAMGGNGGAASTSTFGVNGVAPGGGGGASRTQSGAGARGEMRIWGII